jgi:hypothetical protein
MSLLHVARAGCAFFARNLKAIETTEPAPMKAGACPSYYIVEV